MWMTAKCILEKMRTKKEETGAANWISYSPAWVMLWDWATFGVSRTFVTGIFYLCFCWHTRMTKIPTDKNSFFRFWSLQVVLHTHRSFAGIYVGTTGNDSHENAQNPSSRVQMFQKLAAVLLRLCSQGILLQKAQLKLSQFQKFFSFPFQKWRWCFLHTICDNVSVRRNSSLLPGTVLGSVLQQWTFDMLEVCSNLQR